MFEVRKQVSTTKIKLSENCTVEPFMNNEKPTVEHPNESIANVTPSHDNCRHKGTETCAHYIKIKSTYEQRTGKEIQKQYCMFWAYQPVGLWRK